MLLYQITSIIIDLKTTLSYTVMEIEAGWLYWVRKRHSLGYFVCGSTPRYGYGDAWHGHVLAKVVNQKPYGPERRIYTWQRHLSPLVLRIEGKGDASIPWWP